MTLNPQDSSYFDTEVLIIGSGIAGAVTTLQLADAGVHVTLVTRAKRPEESNTFYAQGGIVYTGHEDSPQLLAEDILRAGAGYCNPRAVEILTTEGPRLAKEILFDKVGVPFDRTENDELSLVREGGHSISRIVHATDATGKAIEVSLLKAIEGHRNVQLLAGYTAVDLLTPAHHSLNRLKIYDPLSCVGAYLLDQENNVVVRCLAKKTVLATGGLGQIYLRTTNPSGARGDGLAMAYRAGARVINSEFVQFHPTAFYQPNAPCFLISEAVRGAGARLVEATGKPFMEKYDSVWKDLAPRDVVSRSIHQEMLSQDIPNVYLDLSSYIPVDKIKELFPSIYQQCLLYGVDITSDLVPVVPAAHYFCGGVWVDEWGRTSVDSLYAVGEVSCTGLHGANRLASTSLLEGLVWGCRAAENIMRTIKDANNPADHDIPLWQDTGTDTADPALISQDMSVLKHIMWNYVGLVRTTRRLQRAIRELRHLESEIERFYRAVRLTDELIGLRNAVRNGLIVTLAAWENKNSVGCHYRI
ncbi:MAG: L-aspartate oxidase [Bacteroidetes bacterium]|nr:L-aspartate oxidase [Bacteroidota bacterium]MCL5737179.1 L-aspartate oxidase [Bacteroidota bacterium]